MRARHAPTAETRKLVETLAAYGTPQGEICTVIGIKFTTLRKYYALELDKAATHANANVAGALYKAAMSGNVTAQIFWLKTRARWKQEPDFDPAAPPREPVLGKKEIAQQEAKSAADGSDWGDDLVPNSIN